MNWTPWYLLLRCHCLGWQMGRRTRSEVYHRITVLMGLTKDEAHIGKFDEQQCRIAIDLAADHNLWRTI